MGGPNIFWEKVLSRNETMPRGHKKHKSCRSKSPSLCAECFALENFDSTHPKTQNNGFEKNLLENKDGKDVGEKKADTKHEAVDETKDFGRQRKDECDERIFSCHEKRCDCHKKTVNLRSHCQVIKREEFRFPEKNFQALNEQDNNLAKGMSRFDPPRQALAKGHLVMEELIFGVHDLDNSDGEPTKFLNAFPPGAQRLSTNALYGWNLAVSSQPQKEVGLGFDVPDNLDGKSVRMLVTIHSFVSSTVPNSSVTGAVEFHVRVFNEHNDEVWGVTSTPSAEGRALVENVNTRGIMLPEQQFKSFTAKVRVDPHKAQRPFRAGEHLEVLIERITPGSQTEFADPIFVDGVDVEFVA